MPKIMIPALGDTIELEEDWVFRLYDESRNDKLQSAASLYPPYRRSEWKDRSWQELTIAERKAEIDTTGWVYEKYEGGLINDFWSGNWNHEMIFRAGTHLTFDRYYIRQGQTAFDSVTFRTKLWVSQPGDPLFRASRKLKSLRFWAKLDQVNDIIAKKVTPHY